MKIVPTTRECRWGLALFPFKAYIVGVPVVVMLSVFISEWAGWNDLGNSWYGAHGILERERAQRYVLLEYGYLVCIVALLLGACYQPAGKGRRSALIFTLLALVLVALLYPATLVVKTR